MEYIGVGEGKTAGGHPFTDRMLKIHPGRDDRES